MRPSAAALHRKEGSSVEPINEIIPIEMDQFLSTVIQFKMDKMRLVQICASRLPAQYELSYCFARELDKD